MGKAAQGTGRAKAAATRRPQARGDATRARLLKAAERLFLRHGYEAVSVERIVQAAKLTKGAFYHHFRDKLALFTTVFEAVDREMSELVAQGGMAGAAPLQMIALGARRSFELSAHPRYGRMVYIEGPTALGWQRWYEIDSALARDVMQAGLEAAVESGELAPGSVDSLATLLLGAIMQGGIVIAMAEDPQAAQRSLADEMDRLLAALSQRAAPRRTTRIASPRRSTR